MNELLCFGLGYSASALARLLRPLGWRVVGTTKTVEAGARAESSDEMLVFDGSKPASRVADALQSATHVLISIPPSADGDPVHSCHGSDLASAPNLRWIGYLSTVGVYGNWDGAWVDEESELRPTSERSRRRVAAELGWRDFASRTGRPVHIFRLAGIYGPGRSAVDQVRDGTARCVVKPGQVFNRIHVDDIARIVAAAMTGRGSHTIYNLTDDEPCSPQEVIEFAARLVGAPVPPCIHFEDAHLTPMARSFYGENKRVSNRRIHADFPGALFYPSYREGLAAVAKSV